MIMNGLTRDHKESRQHLARVLQNGEWSVQRDATLMRENQKRTRMTKTEKTWRMQKMRVIEQNMDVPMPQILEEIVEVETIVDIPVQQSEFILCK